MMHDYTEETEALADELVAFARWRTRLDPIPLGTARSDEELTELVGPTVTPDGIGGHRALELFRDVLAPACLSVDFTRYLSFVPAAPTEAAALFDLVVGAFSIYGGSWIEGSGAAHAENRGPPLAGRSGRAPVRGRRGVRSRRGPLATCRPWSGPAPRPRPAWPRPDAIGPTAGPSWSRPRPTRLCHRRPRSWTPS